MARPTKYNPLIAKKICLSISTSSKGLVNICKSPGMPNVSTIYDWLANPKYKEFTDNYTRAREEQADLLADEIIAIADDGSSDTEIRYTAIGEPYSVEDKEWTSRSKLRVEARKWKASKLAPKKYGDKVDVTSDGEKLNGLPKISIAMDGQDISLKTE